MTLTVEVNVSQSELAYLRAYHYLRRAEQLSTVEKVPRMTGYFDFVPEHIVERLVYRAVETAARKEYDES